MMKSMISAALAIGLQLPAAFGVPTGSPGYTPQDYAQLVAHSAPGFPASAADGSVLRTKHVQGLEMATFITSPSLNEAVWFDASLQAPQYIQGNVNGGENRYLYLNPDTNVMFGGALSAEMKFTYDPNNGGLKAMDDFGYWMECVTNDSPHTLLLAHANQHDIPMGCNRIELYFECYNSQGQRNPDNRDCWISPHFAPGS